MLAVLSTTARTSGATQHTALTAPARCTSSRPWLCWAVLAPTLLQAPPTTRSPALARPAPEPWSHLTGSGVLLVGRVGKYQNARTGMATGPDAGDPWEVVSNALLDRAAL